MPFKFLIVPVRDDGRAAQELNNFLGNHRVLAVDRRWVDLGAESFWSICVDYYEGKSGGKTESGTRNRGKDYREILSPKEFALFAQLRDLRKELSQMEGVPVYTIFNNEQLACMVQNGARSNAELIPSCLGN